MSTREVRELELREWLEHKEGRDRLRDLYKTVVYGSSGVAIPSNVSHEGMLAVILTKEFGPESVGA